MTDQQDLERIAAVIETGPYSDTWESLAAYEVPRWFAEAKFGIFLHWGVYSVPAFGNEWYARHMYVEGRPEFEHHRATYGSQDEFGYADFIPSFTADAYDPDAWAQLFREAGAQFVVPVAEHHDGFAMYDSGRSRWKATAMGPQRDVLGELAESVRRQSMVFGASSHRAEHWWFMNGGTLSPSDVLNPATADFYGPAQSQAMQPNDQFLIDWFLRTIEIIDTFEPQVLWFDWWIEQPAFEPWLRKIAAYYYNQAVRWHRGVVIQYKYEAFRPGTAVYDIERGALGGIHPTVWQNDTSVSRNSWSWIEDHDYKSADEILAELVDVVSKNGVLLLNLGPKPDGTIAEPEQQLLQTIGRWLGVHGEAIYGTRPWQIAAEGPTEQRSGYFTDSSATRYTASDFRFTSRKGVEGEFLYATALDWPADGQLRVASFGSNAGLVGGAVADVTVLGHSGELAWSVDPDALHVTLPADRPSSFGVTVRVEVAPAEPGKRRTGFHL
ncbi:alpha-L-fucosidase [uncultured Friedmanniella sp.]|uniref:alpha-L-fucosidase n=1 Tax=uncultured Friedmanniella sp. TaxID=335381 RepID=UPI0035CBC24C